MNPQSIDVANGTEDKLPAERIDVWVVPLSIDRPTAYDEIRSWLADDELARADRFKFEDDAHRFVIGRGALRSILASYTDSSPEDIRFVYGEHGKPMLGGGFAAFRLEFNASGSDKFAACALTLDRSVGIDIECVRPAKDFDGIVERFFSPRERQSYAKLASEEKHAAFYRGWTRKEAYLKAIGTGLMRSLSSFEITLGPDESAQLVADNILGDRVERWTFHDFEPAPNYVGSVVVAGECRRIFSRQWSLPILRK
jgi:4'-phosphopantetheinyl transferase